MIVVGLVPARGGSKGIPRKNITLLGGKPLLAYTAAAASSSQRLSRCILSTDDSEIAAIGREHGLEVPFMRPPELSTDAAASIDVVIHAIEMLSQSGVHADAIVLLQPTAPFRTARDIDNAVQLLERENADSVVSVSEVPSHYSSPWQLSIDGNGGLMLASGRPLKEIVTRRQLLPKAYYRNGAIYAVRRAIVCEQRSLYGDRCLGYVMPGDGAINIDGPEDLAEAERLIAVRNQSPPESSHLDGRAARR